MSGTTLPLLMSSSGPQPTPATALQQALVAGAQAIDPSITLNLPASLLENLSSTSVADLALQDQARVDAVASVSPLGANDYVLNLLGQQFGIPRGLATNASVNVVFSGPVGYVIPSGFVVSDGVNQYAVQGGTVIGTSGQSPQVTAVCTNSNVFSIPANSVTILASSVPSGYNVTVTNPQAGTPAQGAQSSTSYRAQILQAVQATVTGTIPYLKTQLAAVPGVNPNQISVQQESSSIKVVCGGGNSYEVALAILGVLVNPGVLTGSTVSSSRNITVSLFDAPDTYSIVYVNPVSQTVTVAVTWNTTLANFTSGAQVASLGAPAVQSYLNGLAIGQPINLITMSTIFVEAVSSVISEENLTTLTFAVTINGTAVSPEAGTSIIVGDVEGYFTASNSAVTVTQG